MLHDRLDGFGLVPEGMGKVLTRFLRLLAALRIHHRREVWLHGRLLALRQRIQYIENLVVPAQLLLRRLEDVSHRSP